MSTPYGSERPMTSEERAIAEQMHADAVVNGDLASAALLADFMRADNDHREVPS